MLLTHYIIWRVFVDCLKTKANQAYGRSLILVWLFNFISDLLLACQTEVWTSDVNPVTPIEYGGR